MSETHEYPASMDVDPLYGLRLQTPRLELRLGSRAEILALARVAEKGIHPPEQMPFAVAWSDAIGEPGWLDSFVAFHEDALASWSPAEWTLNLLVWEDGRPIGTQGISASAFAERRRVATGSWLGRQFQGRGLGTEMRAAVLELAFRGLGSAVAESSWLEGNIASRRVSQKLGYVETGVGEKSPRGEPVPEHAVEIERGAWHCPIEVEIAGLERCLPLFGLSATS